MSFGKHRDRVEGRIGAWTQTLTGGKFFPLDPRREDFEGKQFEIAEQMAKKPRYSGATPGVFYGNAEHCYHVSVWAGMLARREYVPESMARECERYALLHDASDAYIPDVPTPIKHDMPEFGDMFRPIEARVLNAILSAFGVNLRLHGSMLLRLYGKALVRRADREVANAECRLLTNPSMAGYPDYATADVKLLCLEWRDARDLWLERFYDLFSATPEVAR